ncbi:hypothetical protein [Ferruginibacter sp. SUN106]|uniref:hypothetical protein n=1 Tax=Ferruginibacter sp. SUN106 TaxID=2978348 RepID=UPI003D35A011
MNNEVVQFILSLSIGPAVIIGIIKFKTIDKSYYPFFYLATISLLVEIISYILIEKELFTVKLVMINIFCLIEFFFYTWLFHLWGLFNFKQRYFIYIMASAVVIWLVFSFYPAGFTSPNMYFRVIYGTTLLFFAVTAFNKLVIQDRAYLVKNPKFWILLGVIIFFSFYLLSRTASLSLFGIDTSKQLRRGLQEVIGYSNLIVNLMFAIGALCIPRKKNFTTLF